jgi:hypothetical protein
MTHDLRAMLADFTQAARAALASMADDEFYEAANFIEEVLGRHDRDWLFGFRHRDCDEDIIAAYDNTTTDVTCSPDNPCDKKGCMGCKPDIKQYVKYQLDCFKPAQWSKVSKVALDEDGVWTIHLKDQRFTLNARMVQETADDLPEGSR